jgi:hypothetical protein
LNVLLFKYLTKSLFLYIARCLNVNLTELTCLSNWNYLRKVEFKDFRIIDHLNQLENAFLFIQKMPLNKLKIEHIKNLYTYESQKKLLLKLKNNFTIRHLELIDDSLFLNQELIDYVSSMTHLKELIIGSKRVFQKPCNFFSFKKLESLKFLVITCQGINQEIKQFNVDLKE